MAHWAGATEVNVNSLHGQGLNKLGDNLIAEAMAPDGLIEAIRLDSDDTFLLAVQWHPEQTLDDLRLFEALMVAAKVGD